MPQFIAESKDYGTFFNECRAKKPVVLLIRYLNKVTGEKSVDVEWCADQKAAKALWASICKNPVPDLLITDMEFIDAVRANAEAEAV